MHGLGNDFVIIDCRAGPLLINADAARVIADRHIGIGCDQIILIEPPHRSDAEIRLTFLNADGSVAGACGNGTRCVAALVLEETGKKVLSIETNAGLLTARQEIEEVTVDMGAPQLRWDEIPLAHAMDTLLVPFGLGDLDKATCTGMGNPHATFFVQDVNAIDLSKLGPLIEHNPIFPQRVNVGIAQVETASRLRLRVWERGAGETLACGSGACAALVAAVRRGLTTRAVEIVLSLGSLMVRWTDDDHVLLSGPCATSFVGEISLSQLMGKANDHGNASRRDA